MRLVLEHRPIGLAAALVLASVATLAFAIVLFSRGNGAGVIFLCFAVSPPVYAWFFLETRRIVLDRSAGTVALDYRAPRGRRGSVHELTPDARAAVQRPGPTPEAREVPETGAPGVPTRAVLVAPDGSEVALAEGYSKGAEAWRVAQAVNAWLSAA